MAVETEQAMVTNLAMNEPNTERINTRATGHDTTQDEGSADLLAEQLSQLRFELSSQPQSIETAASDLARIISSTYVESDSFLLLFLRADNFNPKLAAKRLRAHFTKKLELFGPQHLVGPITVNHLSLDDHGSLSSGGVVMLPEKDGEGRVVVVTRYGAMAYSEVLNMSRALWLIIMTALEVGFVQNPGIAWITLEDGASNADKSLLSEIGSCAMSLPIRIVTLHYCCSTKRQGEATPDILMQSLAASNNIHTQIHIKGTSETWIQDLVSAGIPAQATAALLFPGATLGGKETSTDAAERAAERHPLQALHGERKRRSLESQYPLASKVQRTEHGSASTTSTKEARLSQTAHSPSGPVKSLTNMLQPTLRGIETGQAPTTGPSKMASGDNPGTNVPQFSSALVETNLLNSHLFPFIASLRRQQNSIDSSSIPQQLQLLLGSLQSTQGTRTALQDHGAQLLLEPPRTTAQIFGIAHSLQHPLGLQQPQGVAAAHQRSVHISSHLAHPAAGQEQQDPSPTNDPAAHAVATSHPLSSSLQQRGPRSDQETPSIAPQLRTGRQPLLLYSQSDDATLSAYQCLVRQQIEIFEATEDDVQFNVSKMSKTIVLGQVGIRCRHCAVLAQYSRPKAAVYYPRTLDSLYQFGQNMVKNHLCATCQSIPRGTKQTLMILQEERRRGKGGRDRWAAAAREMDVVEDQHGLRFG